MLSELGTVKWVPENQAMVVWWVGVRELTRSVILSPSPFPRPLCLCFACFISSPRHRTLLVVPVPVSK